MAYLAGNIAKFDVTFTTTSTGAVIDPTTVKFSYSLNGGPAQDSITYTGGSAGVGSIGKISTGVYETWVDTTGMVGTLVGAWVATGTGAAAVDDFIVVGQTTGTGFSFGDLIEKVYRRVMGGIRERAVFINQTGGIGSNDSTVTLTGAQLTGVVPGALLAIDLELLYVESVSGNTATVLRGYNGSVKATHANGSISYINPRYSRYDIGVAINDDLRSLSSPSSGLFRVGVATITYNPVFAGYDLGDLPDNFIDILSIRYRIAPPYRTFPPIKRWRVLRSIPDASIPSGRALIIYEAGWPGLPIYVEYSAPFIQLVNQSDSLLQTPTVNDIAPPHNGYKTTTASNLYPDMVDIPPLGAAIDLTLPREISRNFMESQPDPRKALEVPFNSVAGSVQAMAVRRAQRISEEADRLRVQYRRVKGW